MSIAPAAADSTRIDRQVVGLVSVGHFFSHYCTLAVPPLFPLLHDVWDVSYASLAIGLVVSNLITMLAQAPLGVAVDRFGAHRILVAGLALLSASVGLIALVDGYWGYIALMVLGGMGNSVFHPADYAILGERVSPARMGRAYALHTFAGFAGFAAAPVAMAGMATVFDWRMAFAVSGAAGLVFTLVLASRGTLMSTGGARAETPATGGAPSARLLLTPAILMAFVFYTLSAAGHSGLVHYSVAALTGHYGISLTDANLVLTGFLAASAIGILIGGVIAERAESHATVAILCLTAEGVLIALVGIFALPITALAAVLFVAGIASGAVFPSRDMMVRALTPPGASGRVFGFVMTGLNVGSIVAPPLYGLMLDHGHNMAIFLVVAAIALVSIATVRGVSRGTG